MGCMHPLLKLVLVPQKYVKCLDKVGESITLASVTSEFTVYLSQVSSGTYLSTTSKVRMNSWAGRALTAKSQDINLGL